ncbi:helix-turn-helix transcriptional regulator [Capillibacterium thermochitinicola]|uniref:YafY family transcriptional regulator n=1 Tax=Capillibacterium thermochitinicola TaxID=2699427 RepID=A0A8J6I2I5_9FIRM|nr:YafY family protein [Capillibacterium thermochitinicola]MBA2133778.1 YafY family transcriptional regulator [Capillibacterium thermochitinicola]
MSRKDRLSRLLEMFFIIQAVPGLSASELAERCGVSIRQCYRDLRTLEEGGVPIYNERGYRILKGSVLKDISFTLEEAMALIYGLKLIEQQNGLLETSCQALEKLMNRLPKGLRNKLGSIEERVEIDITPAADYSNKGPLFKAINTAIQEQKILEIDYYSFSRDTVTTRKVNPYKLVFKDGFWYLVGYCHHRDKVRVFRVDRIRCFSLTSEKFALPTDFDFEKYMGAAWQMERGEEFYFKVRFFGEAARFIRETTFHPSQQLIEEPEGTVLFTARAGGMRSVLRWVLSFGDKAEVLEPQTLRYMMAEVMAAGVKRYRGKRFHRSMQKKEKAELSND